MSPSLKEGLLAGADTSNGSGELGRCPIKDFQLPQVFSKHPGGQEHLKMARSNDCAGLLFLVYHMGLDIDGVVAQTMKNFGLQVPERGPLFDEVHDMVRKVREEHKVQVYIFQVWCLAITVLLPVTFVWALLSLGVLAGIAVCLMFEFYFLNIFHTRHHKGGFLYGNTTLDVVLNPLYDFIDSTWGYYPPAWQVTHHVNHHMHTNDEHKDPDLPATYPIIRLFDSQEKLWFHKFQTFYWPLLLPFSVARFPVSNLLEHGGHPVNFVAWLAFMWALPVYMHGVAGLIWTMLLQGLVGINITYKFAISHAHVDHTVKQYEKKAKVYDMKADEFIRDQIEESSSWGGYWSTLLFGGLNMQIEHHIAPGLEPPLYAFVALELRRICAKHQITYISEPTLLHALAKFHIRLWMSG